MKKIIVILAAVFGLDVNTIVAQQKESMWTEIQQVEIPAGQTLHEGLTKNGNPKYWFEFGDIKVNVSPGSATKYKSNTTTLLLVKWQHKETLKIKYSVRQKSTPKKATPNVDLTTLFN